jgi:hypothetical protein
LTFPLTVIADPFAVRLPSVERVRPPAVMLRFEADVVRIVDPTALAVEFRRVRVPPIRSPFAAIV